MRTPGFDRQRLDSKLALLPEGHAPPARSQSPPLRQLHILPIRSNPLHITKRRFPLPFDSVFGFILQFLSVLQRCSSVTHLRVACKRLFCELVPKTLNMLIIQYFFIFCKNDSLFFPSSCHDDLITWVTMKGLWQNCRLISNPWR